MDLEFVPLRIVGITSTQIENGMYALVLEEIGGSLRIPIIIGYTDAQSIECLLQKITTPRPLTHEFASRILESFDIRIVNVLIKQLPNGIFTADITLRKDGETHVIDARSSDAIAVATRCGAPIFTTRDLIDKVGIDRDALTPRQAVMPAGVSIPARQAIARVANSDSNPFEDVSDEKLMKLLEKAVEDEDYEKAGEIKEEIDRRNCSENNDF